MVLVAAALAGALGALLLVGGSSGAARSPMSSRFARLMSLSDATGHAAPSFTLTDQHGVQESLGLFRGSVVILEFMDPHCTDICPIVAAEFERAAKDLGSAAAKVDFVAVNVNRYANSVQAIAQFSREQGLDKLRNWYFLTGSPSVLAKVWAEYGIAVISRGPTADVIHSSYIFFIDPAGRERYIASPTDLHTSAGTAYLPLATQLRWGRGIASYARELLGR